MAWDTEWAAERAAEAMRYLADDREAYLEALRGYMRAGRAVALQVRKEAACSNS